MNAASQLSPAETALKEAAFVKERSAQGPHAAAKALPHFSTLAKQQISFLWSKDGDLRVAQPKELKGFWGAWSDGSYDPATGVGAIGGVLRDEFGAPKALFSRSLGPEDFAGAPAGALSSEREALLEALNLAADAGAERVEVKLDCLSLLMRVISCQKKGAPPNTLEQPIAEALRRFEEVSLRWIPRELNSLADALSKRPAGKGVLFGGENHIKAFNNSVDTGALFHPGLVPPLTKKKGRPAVAITFAPPPLASRLKGVKDVAPRPIHAPKKPIGATPQGGLPGAPAQASAPRWAIGASPSPDQGWGAACALIEGSPAPLGDELAQRIGKPGSWSWGGAPEQGARGAMNAIKKAFKRQFMRSASTLAPDAMGVVELSPSLYQLIDESGGLSELEQRLTDVALRQGARFSARIEPSAQFSQEIEQRTLARKAPSSEDGEANPASARSPGGCA